MAKLLTDEERALEKAKALAQEMGLRMLNTRPRKIFGWSVCDQPGGEALYENRKPSQCLGWLHGARWGIDIERSHWLGRRQREAAYRNRRKAV